MFAGNVLVNSLLVSSALAISGPSTFDELNEVAYPGAPHIEFTPLPNFPHAGIAGNNTAILKVFDIFSSHYPIKFGHIKFAIDHQITKEIPADSKLDIVSFIDDDLLFNGTVNLCEYLSFAKLDCPLQPQEGRQINKQTLRVPKEANDGRLSFIAKAYTPSNELIAHVGGMIDLINDGTEALEENDPTNHDEL